MTDVVAKTPDFDYGFANVHADSLKSAETEAANVVANALEGSKEVKDVNFDFANTTAATNTTANDSDKPEEKSNEEIAASIKKLEAERDEMLKKINDKFEGKAFALRQKTVSLSERRGIAHGIIEKMRASIRERLNQPYLDDANVDSIIEAVFDKGLNSEYPAS